MSDPRTLFGDVRSAAHRADPDALVTSIEAIEASGDAGLLDDALAYAHEVLWRGGERAVAGALRRWPHPDALPVLAWRSASGCDELRPLQQSVRARRAPAAWVEGALLEVLSCAQRLNPVWTTLLTLDLPRLHRAALAHPSSYVVRSARVPPEVSVAHSRKRALLVRSTRLDAAEVEHLEGWAGDDFGRLCALAGSSHTGVRARACGRLLERLAEVPRARLDTICSPYPGAHTFARSLLGHADGFDPIARTYARMTPDHRRLYRDLAADALPDHALLALAHKEPDAQVARDLARDALERVEDAATYANLRAEFRGVSVAREFAPTATLAWRWMRQGNRDPALSLLGELELVQNPPLRRALADRVVSELLADRAPLPPRDVEPVAWLPMMFKPMRQALSRAGELPEHLDAWRSAVFGLPPARAEVEVRPPPPTPRPRRARRGAPKSGPRPRPVDAIAEYWQDLADLGEDPYGVEGDYYLADHYQYDPWWDPKSVGLRDEPECCVELMRDDQGMFGALHWLDEGGEDALERVLRRDGITHITLDAFAFRGSREAAEEVCRRVGATFDPDASIRMGRDDEDEGHMLDVEEDWRARFEEVVEEGERVGGRVSLSHWALRDEDLHALAGMADPRELHLSYTRVTGAGLARIARSGWFPSLRRLEARGLDVRLDEVEPLLARGAIEAVAVTLDYTDTLAAHALADARLEPTSRHADLVAWTRSPRADAPTPFGMSARDLRTLASRPELLLANQLNLRYCEVGRELVEVFLTSPMARNLTHIRLSARDHAALAGVEPARDPRVRAEVAR